MALSPQDKRALIILGVVAGLAAVVGVFMLLGGGGGGTDEAATGTGTAVPLPTGGGAPTSQSPVGTVDAFPITCCDPFSPLVQPSPSATETPSPGATTTSSPSPATSSDTTTVQGRTVTLKEIIDRPKGAVVEVQVEGTTYKDLSQGDKFAQYFTVDAISTDVSCASFEFKQGKTTETFRLCIE